MLAEKLGIDVAVSSVMNTGSGEDPEILFVSGRYDRSYNLITVGNHEVVVLGHGDVNKVFNIQIKELFIYFFFEHQYPSQKHRFW